MAYRTFTELNSISDVTLATNILSLFPGSFRREFRDAVQEHPAQATQYTEAIVPSRDPIDDGIVLGKAGGRYQFNHDRLLAIAVVRHELARFAAPAYFLPREGWKGYIDANEAVPLRGSIHTRGLEHIVEEIQAIESRFIWKKSAFYAIGAAWAIYEFDSWYGIPASVLAVAAFHEATFHLDRKRAYQKLARALTTP